MLFRTFNLGESICPIKVFSRVVCPIYFSSSDHEIKSETDRVRKVFQDSTGSHLLVCMKSKDCYYIGQASRRPQPRLVPKIKNQVIESVAWNKLELKESTGGTGAILLGTGQGTLCGVGFELIYSN